MKTCKWFIFSTSVFCSCKLFVNVQMWFLVFFVHVFQFHKFWNDHINDPNRPSLSFTSIPLSVHPNQTNQTRTAINFNDKCIKWMPLKRSSYRFEIIPISPKNMLFSVNMVFIFRMNMEKELFHLNYRINNWNHELYHYF